MFLRKQIELNVTKSMLIKAIVQLCRMNQSGAFCFSSEFSWVSNALSHKPLLCIMAGAENEAL